MATSRSRASRRRLVLVDAGDVVVHVFRPSARLLRAGEDVGARDGGRRQAQGRRARPATPPQEAGVKLWIACIGRAGRGPERDLYQTLRGPRRWPLALREVEEKRKLPAAQLILREGELLLQSVPAKSVLVALDRRGKVLDSEGFGPPAGTLA